MSDPQDEIPWQPPDERVKISDRPMVTFKGPGGSMEIKAKADTGAARTTIDHRIASKIGAGPIEKIVQVDDERRPVVPVMVKFSDIEVPANVSLSDRRGPNYPGEQKMETDALLGNSLLELCGVYCNKDG